MACLHAKVDEDRDSLNLLPSSSSPHRLFGGHEPGGEVDLDIVGGVTMLSIKQSATNLAKCYR